MVYTFGCVAYALSTYKPKAEKLLWWDWKERSRFGLTRLRGVIPQ